MPPNIQCKQARGATHVWNQQFILVSNSIPKYKAYACFSTLVNSRLLEPQITCENIHEHNNFSYKIIHKKQFFNFNTTSNTFIANRPDTFQINGELTQNKNPQP